MQDAPPKTYANLCAQTGLSVSTEGYAGTIILTQTARSMYFGGWITRTIMPVYGSEQNGEGGGQGEGAGD